MIQFCVNYDSQEKTGLKTSLKPLLHTSNVRIHIHTLAGQIVCVIINNPISYFPKIGQPLTK
jgi:hypothetical protein